MIPLRNLFEAHLTVRDLDRSMEFYGGLLGLPLARVFPEQRVAFYWIGSPGNSMLGIWETSSASRRLSLRVAFTVDLPLLLKAPEQLRKAGVLPLDFWQKPAHEPVVLAWMPAAAVYFSDPDGNLLEFISILPDAAQAELGIVGWNDWSSRELPWAQRSGNKSNGRKVS
jgi:lactoylglutathione lyase